MLKLIVFLFVAIHMDSLERHYRARASADGELSLFGEDPGSGDWGCWGAAKRKKSVSGGGGGGTPQFKQDL